MQPILLARKVINKVAEKIVTLLEDAQDFSLGLATDLDFFVEKPTIFRKKGLYRIRGVRMVTCVLAEEGTKDQSLKELRSGDFYVCLGFPLKKKKNVVEMLEVKTGKVFCFTLYDTGRSSFERVA